MLYDEVLQIQAKNKGNYEHRIFDLKVVNYCCEDTRG